MAWPKPGSFGRFAVLFSAGLALQCHDALSAGEDPRHLELRGFPDCPPGQVYARPMVVRIDRDRSLFEQAWSTRVRVLAPPPRTVAVDATVPRGLSQAVIRIGLCRPNLQATWDCEAAQWLTERSVVLDRKQTPYPWVLPTVTVPCRR